MRHSQGWGILADVCDGVNDESDHSSEFENERLEEGLQMSVTHNCNSNMGLLGHNHRSLVGCGLAGERLLPGR